MKTLELSAAQVRDLIGIPIHDWPGNCSGVAKALRRKLGFKPTCDAYGLWTGPMLAYFLIEGRMFPSPFANRGQFTHHAWIELADGSVIDPTRWIFEGKEPYVYYGPSDHYDFGGNQVRESMMTPPPQRWESDREPQWPDFGNAVDKVNELLRYNEDEARDMGYSFEQLMWLANLAPETIGKFWVAEIYDALTAVGMGAAIPHDSRKRYR